MAKITTGTTNGNIKIVPNGTGKTVVGTGAANATVQSSGNHDLVLQTGNITTGSITITDGANGNIAITPNGTGEVDISKVDIDGGTIDGTTIGGTTPAAGTFTTFTSTGITDNASTTALTIDSSGKVGIWASSPATTFHASKSYVTPAGGISSSTIGIFSYNNTASASANVSILSRSSGSSVLQFGNEAIENVANIISSGATPYLAFGVSSSNTTAATERVRIDNSGNLKFDSGYGSVATAYGCRAWVNFNGTGTVAIRASGNVSSITDNGTGDYTVNFTTAMPDSNYSVVSSCTNNTYTTPTDTSIRAAMPYSGTYPTGSIRMICKYVNYNSSAQDDQSTVSVGIFR